MASASPQSYDVVIAGGGFSGLLSAVYIRQQLPSARIVILESSPSRLGGRIFSSAQLEAGGSGERASGIDLGPAWVWLEQQPYMRRLLLEGDGGLGLGARVVKQAGGRDGEHRIEGGMGAVVEMLAARLGLLQLPMRSEVALETGAPTAAGDGVDLLMGARAVEVDNGVGGEGDGRVSVKVERQGANGTSAIKILVAKQLLIAFPPAKAATEVRFSNSDKFLTAELLARMSSQPVWMAPMGKLALLYEERFWDPGRVMGGVPAESADDFYGAVQVYDAGQTTDGRHLHALVCFVVCGSLLDDTKIDHAAMKTAIAQRAVQQLHVTFGLDRFKLASFKDVEFKCWRADGHISSVDTSENFPEHPRPIRGLNGDVPGRRVFFVNSEAADAYTGMLEGAARVAEEGAKRVVRQLAG